MAKNIDKNNQIGERIRFAREALHLSQSEVAKKLGMTIPAISKYEKGLRKINLSKLDVLADALCVTQEWIISGAVGGDRNQAFVEHNKIMTVSSITNEEEKVFMPLEMNSLLELRCECCRLRRELDKVREKNLMETGVLEGKLDAYRLRYESLTDKVDKLLTENFALQKQLKAIQSK